MIQKKICMVGAFGVGKTSLVARIVHTRFDEGYHTTLGVKVDKKALSVNGRDVNLMLWDIAGEDALTRIKPTQIRGASGYILVADGTRLSTLDAAIDLHSRIESEIGQVPFTLVVNKSDLRPTWEVDAAALARIEALAWPILLTSAKTGEAVEELFHSLAQRMLQPGSADA